MPGLRPTSERIRETLFNWLEPRIAGARCLDLFAGSGALGLEALSRGAASVVLVERDELAANVLQGAVRSLDARGATLVRADARNFLETCPAQSFDLVFLDPPFAGYPAGELCRLLDASGCLAGGALVYLEQDRAAPPPVLPAGWTATRERTAGNVRYALISTSGGTR